MKVLEHDFVSEQCKWNCPPMVWNAPSWHLKGDNWKIQDTAIVGEGSSCSCRFNRCMLDPGFAELAFHFAASLFLVVFL